MNKLSFKDWFFKYPFHCLVSLDKQEHQKPVYAGNYIQAEITSLSGGGKFTEKKIKRVKGWPYEQQWKKPNKQWNVSAVVQIIFLVVLLGEHSMNLGRNAFLCQLNVFWGFPSSMWRGRQSSERQREQKFG